MTFPEESVPPPVALTREELIEALMVVVGEVAYWRRQETIAPVRERTGMATDRREEAMGLARNYAARLHAAGVAEGRTQATAAPVGEPAVAPPPVDAPSLLDIADASSRAHAAHREVARLIREHAYAAGVEVGLHQAREKAADRPGLLAHIDAALDDFRDACNAHAAARERFKTSGGEFPTLEERQHDARRIVELEVEATWTAGVAEGRRQATEERTEDEPEHRAGVAEKGCLGAEPGHGLGEPHFWKCSTPGCLCRFPGCAGHLCRPDGLTMWLDHG